MAVKPLKILDAKGRQLYSGGSLNETAANWWTGNRRYLNSFQSDAERNLGAWTRARLSDEGRHAYENNSIVRAALNQIGRYATQHLICQSESEDRPWAEAAEWTLLQHNKIIDLAGWPYDYDTYRLLMLASVLYDGDCGTLLTETTNGWPAIQMIPGHRIGSAGEEEVKSGAFSGARLVDGAIVDNYGTAIGYRILNESKEFLADVSANDFFLTFIPSYPGQVRGYSLLGAALMDFRDVAETRGYEKISQKRASADAFVEENESGEPELPSALFESGRTGNASTETMSKEVITGGGITRYFRAGTGSSLTPVQFDRPSANQANFDERILRGALASIGWSFDLAVDATKIGGASMRVVVDMCNRTLEFLRTKVAEKACARIDGWRVAKLIKLGVIPESPDWWRWAYQPPSRLTADRGYDADVSVQELDNLLTSHAAEANKRGSYWQDPIEAEIKFHKYLKERCASEGLDPSTIMASMASRQPKIVPTANRLAMENQTEQ